MFFFKKKVKPEPVSPNKEETKIEQKNSSILPVHQDSVEFNSKEERDNFTNAIGDNFVGRRQLDLTDEELVLMSVADAAEMIRLEQWAMNKLMKPTPEVEQKIHGRMDKIFNQISKKLLALDEIYVIFSKTTGCPYLFVNTYKSEKGYITTPPSIKVYTKANASLLTKGIENSEEMELREIKNNDEKSAIHDFLGYCFYLDGVCRVEVDSEYCMIENFNLVSPPDFGDAPEASRPVVNPEVVRWNLLFRQLGSPDNEEKQIIFGCFIEHLNHALLNAKFLVPMKASEGSPKPEENTESEGPEKKGSFALVTMPGKDGRTAIQLYTDWKRLYENLGNEEKWEGMVTTIEEMIPLFDCAINAHSTYHRGFYLNQDLFEKIKDKKQEQ